MLGIKETKNLLNNVLLIQKSELKNGSNKKKANINASIVATQNLINLDFMI